MYRLKEDYQENKETLPQNILEESLKDSYSNFELDLTKLFSRIDFEEVFEYFLMLESKKVYGASLGRYKEALETANPNLFQKAKRFCDAIAFEYVKYLKKNELNYNEAIDQLREQQVINCSVPR